MDLQLSGKIALVTAASRGIGAAIASRLALEGADVAISSRNGVPLEETRARLQRAGGRVTSHACDLASEQQTEAMFQSVLAKYGSIDILVLNTPGPKLGPALAFSLSDWSDAYNSLVRPCLQLALAASRHMSARRTGSIVFMTSTWIKQPVENGALSSVLRAPLAVLSKQLALELAPHGVRVNHVMPGATDTERTRQVLETKAQRNGTTVEVERALAVKSIPLGRVASADEIADVVAFLASPRAAYVTGATLQVDGSSIRSSL